MFAISSSRASTAASPPSGLRADFLRSVLATVGRRKARIGAYLHGFDACMKSTGGARALQMADDIKPVAAAPDDISANRKIPPPASSSTAVATTSAPAQALATSGTGAERDQELPWLDSDVFRDGNKSRKSAIMFALDSGEGLDRQMYVHLVRHRCGRKRTPVLTIRSGRTGRSLLHLRKEELVGICNLIPKLKQDGLKKTFEPFRT